jgi:hypothetical protein
MRVSGAEVVQRTIEPVQVHRQEDDIGLGGFLQGHRFDLRAKFIDQRLECFLAAAVGGGRFDAVAGEVAGDSRADRQ